MENLELSELLARIAQRMPWDDWDLTDDECRLLKYVKFNSYRD